MRFELPCPLLLRAAYAAAAAELRLSVDDVERIAFGAAALRDGKVLSEIDFFDAYPDDTFARFSGPAMFPERLLVRSIELSRDPSLRFTPPITDADRAAADVWLNARRLVRLTELDAPEILLRVTRNHLQSACEPAAANADRWQPVAELMTGAPAEPGAAGVPSPMFAVPYGIENDETTPGDAALLADGLVVGWQFLTAVFNLDGTIRDAFPSCGLRVVGGDPRYLSLVCGGGGLAHSGYFGAEVFVRDTREHRWLPRGEAVPASLPRFVAGTIGDVKWAVVVDVQQGVGYRTSPRIEGDQCGETFNSACGRFAWDRERFVLEAATGEAVLDVECLRGALVGFAKTERGWRFLMIDEGGDDEPLKLRLKDEDNTVVRELGVVEGRLAVALSADGRRLLRALPDQLSVTDADSGAALGPTFDLSSMAPALRLPASDELWQRLGAAYGAPCLLAKAQRPETAASARAAIAGTYGDDPTDTALAAAIEAAARCPPLPSRVPTT